MNFSIHRDESAGGIERLRFDQGPIYPVSCGRNWGYGGARPTAAGGEVLDLSGMTRVVDFDDELGLVTVEPGVTQGDLYRFLQERGGRWIVPTSGAGPTASVLGNALERGYGLAAHGDHFGAVTAIEAILPDGSRYRGALSELGGEKLDRAFKWGLGPYVDGLFTQGNFGVVVRATIALAPKPEKAAAILFRLDDDAAVPAAVDAVRELLHRCPAGIQAINLMNDRRVLSMIEPYPDEVPDDAVMDEATVRRLRGKHGLGAWMGFGVIAGPRGVCDAVRREAKRVLRGRVKGLRLVSHASTRRLRRVLTPVPGDGAAALRRKLKGLGEALDNASGVPSEVALPLCYWRFGLKPRPGEPMDPERDGCGLKWYSPLVPMHGETAAAYAAMVREVTPGFGIEPLITLTTVSPRCFDSTVPLLFNRASDDGPARARSCYDALFDRGRAMGLLPYRVGVDDMDKIRVPGSPYWEMVTRLKRAIDPGDLISPGRYVPPLSKPTAGVGHP